MESEKPSSENEPTTTTEQIEKKNDEPSENKSAEEPSSSVNPTTLCVDEGNKDKVNHDEAEDDDNNKKKDEDNPEDIEKQSSKTSSPPQEQPPSKEVTEPKEHKEDDNKELPTASTTTTTVNTEDGPASEQKDTSPADEKGSSPPAAAATTAEETTAADASASEEKEGTIETAATKQALAATLAEDNHNYEGFKSFPEKLMSLLDSEELKDHIWWLPDGDSFAFIPEGFADAVLNVHFQGTRLESFTRKLNRWGFRRVAGSKVPKNTLAYYHHDFSRGKPEGLKMMTGSNKRAQIMKQKTAEKKSKVDHSQTKADVNASLGYMVPPTAAAYIVPQVLGHNVAQGSAFTPAAFTDPSLAGHPYDPNSIMAMQYYQSQHRRAAAEMALVQEREALLEAELQRMRALRQVGYGAVPPPFANQQQQPLAAPVTGTQNDDAYNASQQTEDQPNVRSV